MNTTGHIERDDLVLFAMQLLSKDDAAVVTAHVERCPECLRELAEVQGDLAVYAHTVEMQAPPAGARWPSSAPTSSRSTIRGATRCASITTSTAASAPSCSI